MPDKLTDVTDNKVGKITDSEIKKALECCCGDSGCFGCPYTENHNCRLLRNPIKDALDLINRLQADKSNLEIELQAMRGAANSYKAEVERLKEENEKLQYYLDCECSRSADVSAMLIGEDKIKAEAYKECVEKVKENMPSSLVYISSDMIENIIDNLLNELEGENNPHNIDKQN